jgi:signal peptidase I
MMKKWMRENRGWIVFFALFGLMRTAVADWNVIPSASMRPTLLEGDVVFVDRVAYDLKLPFTDRALARLGEPRRGDIVVFSSPKDGTRLIKRLVAVPGDTVEMRDKHLVINGRPAQYAARDVAMESLGDGVAVPALRLVEKTPDGEHAIQWLSGIASRDSFAPFVVPEGRYLMLGDNRDDSADSRYFGLVERRLLTGRAERVLVSADVQGIWRPRFDRFGRRLR